MALPPPSPRRSNTFYSIIGAAARKSRLFDATDLNPQVILDEDPIEDFENGQEQSYAA